MSPSPKGSRRGRHCAVVRLCGWISMTRRRFSSFFTRSATSRSVGALFTILPHQRRDNTNTTKNTTTVRVSQHAKSNEQRQARHEASTTTDGERRTNEERQRQKFEQLSGRKRLEASARAARKHLPPASRYLLVSAEGVCHVRRLHNLAHGEHPSGVQRTPIKNDPQSVRTCTMQAQL